MNTWMIGLGIAVVLGLVLGIGNSSKGYGGHEETKSENINNDDDYKDL